MSSFLWLASTLVYTTTLIRFMIELYRSIGSKSHVFVDVQVIKALFLVIAARSPAATFQCHQPQYHLTSLNTFRTVDRNKGGQ